MGFPKNTELEFRYEYDFSVSGGAQGNINLVNKGMNALESGLVITDMFIKVETALTSGGSATITAGNAGDRDGYFVDFFGAAAANAVINRGDRAGALIWDDTDDHPIYYRIGSSADAPPSITIGTADLTAGKFSVYIRAYKPNA